MINETTYAPCPHCLGFVHKTELQKHAKSCQFAEYQCEHPMKAAKILLATMKTGKNKIDHFSKKILCTLKDDNVSKIVKSDELIMFFGSILYGKNGTEKRDYIAQRLRQLG